MSKLVRLIQQLKSGSRYVKGLFKGQKHFVKLKTPDYCFIVKPKCVIPIYIAV
jgi:hypothetical protein